MVATPSIENVKVEEQPNRTTQKVMTKPQNLFMAKPKAKGKSLPKSQRGPQVQHFCHHCGVWGHTRPNYYKLQALKKEDSQRRKGQGKGNWNAKQSKRREANSGFGDVIKIIDTITCCLASFSQRFENHNSSTQSSRDIIPNAHVVWVKKGTHA